MKKVILILLIIFIMVPSLSFGTSQTDDKKSKQTKILMINSYPLSERDILIRKGFSETLKDFNIDFSAFSLEYRQLAKLFSIYKSSNWTTYKKNIVEARKELANKITAFNPDIIVVSDDEAAVMVAPIVSKQNLPMFFVGVNEDIKNSLWFGMFDSSKIAGVIETYPIAATIKIYKRILPIKKVSLLSGGGYSSHLITKQFEAELKKQDVTVDKVYNLSKWSDWKKAVEEINNSSDLVWILVPHQVYDDDGNELGLSTMTNWIKKHLKIPASGISDVIAKMGPIISLTPATYSVGKQSAEQVARYLMGYKMSDIGVVEHDYHDIILNTDIARDLNINIPEDIVMLVNSTHTTNEIIDKVDTK
jgi:putative tryptophan/tyrosine transport system substrate-binding protein